MTMDLSRRRFLGMLGLAPVIPLVAPTKAYSFLGNILRPRLSAEPLPIYMVDFFRINIDGKPEPLYATRPGIDQPMVFHESPTIATVIARLGLENVKALESEYRLNFTKMIGASSMRISESGIANTEGLQELLYQEGMWEDVKRVEIVPQRLFSREELTGKERPIG